MHCSMRMWLSPNIYIVETWTYQTIHIYVAYAACSSSIGGLCNHHRRFIITSCCLSHRLKRKHVELLLANGHTMDSHLAPHNVDWIPHIERRMPISQPLLYCWKPPHSSPNTWLELLFGSIITASFSYRLLAKHSATPHLPGCVYGKHIYEIVNLNSMQRK